MKKIILLLCVIFAGSAFAAKPTTPEPAEAATMGAKYITISDAKKLFDGGAVFLDTRKPMEVSQNRIKGAIRAYYDEKGGNKNKAADWDASADVFQTENIPADKSKALITYCNGEKCWKSYKAAVALTKKGYTNVHWMREGIPAWTKAGNPVE
jgi:rhodanese-related sulfurtransferase